MPTGGLQGKHSGSGHRGIVVTSAICFAAAAMAAAIAAATTARAISSAIAAPRGINTGRKAPVESQAQYVVYQILIRQDPSV